MFATHFLDLPPLAHAGGSIALPGSKSISNRVLLLAALCEGVTHIHDLLDSDDTRVMLVALEALGCAMQQEGNRLRLTGLDGRLPKAPIALFLGNAGTAMRPLTAALSVLGGDFTLSGVPRMHERPIGDLVDALRQLGCHIDYTGQQGFPPLHIGTPSLQLDAPIQVRGDVSSQFLTALLIAAGSAPRHRDRGGGRVDFASLYRHHLKPAGAIWRASPARRLAALCHSRRQPFALAWDAARRSRCIVRQLFCSAGRDLAGQRGHTHPGPGAKRNSGRYPLY
jgi:hypothetical protein